MSDQLVEGRVKWFNKEKGFGFIQMPNGALDVFVHANQLRKSGLTFSLEEGEAVKFYMNSGDKGPFATNISKVSGDASTTVTGK